MTTTFEELKPGEWFKVKGKLTEWQYYGFCEIDCVYLAFSLYGNQKRFNGEELIEKIDYR